MTVTIGGRGTRSSSLSCSSSPMASWMSADTNSVLKPNSSATTTSASASRRWLIDTIRPRFMQAVMTSVAETFIIVATGYGHEFGDLQDGAFLLFALEFFVHALGYGFAFFLAVFRTFALGVFRRQAGQCIFHLLRNLLVADFGTNDGLRSLEFVLAGLLVLSRTGLVGLRALSAAGLCGGFTVAARQGRLPAYGSRPLSLYSSVCVCGGCPV